MGGKPRSFFTDDMRMVPGFVHFDVMDIHGIYMTYDIYIYIHVNIYMYMCIYIWLVVSTPLKNISQLGRIIPYIMENKKCLKLPIK